MSENPAAISHETGDFPSRATAVAWKSHFKVVGIGASAGGLSALKRFFSRISADTGAAYVVVVHLDPERESALDDILQVGVDVPVKQVKGTVKLQPNRIYVIPPGRNLSTIDSHLKLSDIEARRSERAPIDHFLATLANTHGENAIGIILSGTGSDGAYGLARVKSIGGLTFVQDPKDSEYDGMPQSAIASGVVDMVLPAEELSDQVARLLKTHPRVKLPTDPNGLDEYGREILHKIFAQIKWRNGHDFSRYKPSTILRRIRRRMQLLYIEEMDAYLQMIRRDEEEAKALFDDLLITVTHFFRDQEVFAEVEATFIPKLFEDKSHSDHVRVWVVGCATGEEAYTFAILLLEYASKHDVTKNIHVFASDMQGVALTRAREGIYSDSIEADVTPERLARFFTAQKAGGYRVRKEVRELVVFAPHNFLSDPPFSRMDMISCRNVMIYLQREVQRDVLELFHYALNPGGVLLLGTSETVDQSELFRPAQKELCLYYKNNVRQARNRLPALPFSTRREEREAGRGGEPVARIESYGSLHQRVVELYGPPSILINQDHVILHYSENAGRFLVQPGGEPTNNLFRRVREELRVELRGALYAAQELKSPRRSKPVVLAIEGREANVVVRVNPSLEDGEIGYFLVMFDEQGSDQSDGDGTAGDYGAGDVNSREMENELEMMQKRMQVVIEKYETSQEEMRAANEELQSSNEELRSTMEELETSKEELQSMNEELTTVNQENRHKVDELSQMTGDLQNHLAATSIATLFLDRQLRIVRFTSQLGEVFSVRQVDRGRPVTDLRHNLDYQGLEEDANKVLRNLQPIEREVQSARGGCYLLRMIPYRSMEDKIDGVVITLVDVSKLKETEHQLRAHEVELRELTATLEKRVEEATGKVRELASGLTLAEQKERDRIAHVLHDDLQQMLCGLQMRLFLLRQEKDIPPEETEEIFEEIGKAIDMTRILTVDLSPPVLKHEGLMEALIWLKSQMQTVHKLDVLVQGGENLPALSNELRVLAFQIVRELLFNVVKHANTNEATVTIDSVDHAICMEVSDKGVGAPRLAGNDGETAGDGFGLSSIRERVKLFEGRMWVRSATGQGTSVHVEVPIDRKSK